MLRQFMATLGDDDSDSEEHELAGTLEEFVINLSHVPAPADSDQEDNN